MVEPFHRLGSATTLLALNLRASVCLLLLSTSQGNYGNYKVQDVVYRKLYKQFPRQSKTETLNADFQKLHKMKIALVILCAISSVLAYQTPTCGNGCTILNKCVTDSNVCLNIRHVKTTLLILNPSAEEARLLMSK
jgi:hypothetical protein